MDSIRSLRRLTSPDLTASITCAPRVNSPARVCEISSHVRSGTGFGSLLEGSSREYLLLQGGFGAELPLVLVLLQRSSELCIALLVPVVAFRSLCVLLVLEGLSETLVHVLNQDALLHPGDVSRLELDLVQLMR